MNYISLTSILLRSLISAGHLSFQSGLQPSYHDSLFGRKFWDSYSGNSGKEWGGSGRDVKGLKHWRKDNSLSSISPGRIKQFCCLHAGRIVFLVYVKCSFYKISLEIVTHTTRIAKFKPYSMWSSEGRGKAQWV